MNRPSIPKDYVAAAPLLFVGVAVISRGIAYGPGTLHHMGPGFMPVAFGTVLTFVGILIVVTSERQSRAAEHAPLRDIFRFGVGIFAGIIAFIVLATHGGFAPAAFACVFFAALGSRSNTLLAAFALALTIAVAGSLVFAWALDLGIPMFAWS